MTKKMKLILRGGFKMNTLAKVKSTQKIYTMASMKNIIQTSMKLSGITSAEARKSFGIKRYEK